MKNSLLAFLLLAISISSCKKDKVENESNSDPLQGHFYYKDFSPDLEYKMPVQDALSYNLDINNDTISDITIGLNHIYQYNGPNRYDASLITLSGSNNMQFFYENDSVCKGPCQRPLDSDREINLNWRSINIFYLVNTAPLSMINCKCIRNNNYVGFAYNKNGNKYLGWIHLNVDASNKLTIYDFALDTCLDQSIRVGQH